MFKTSNISQVEQDALIRVIFSDFKMHLKSTDDG